MTSPGSNYGYPFGPWAPPPPRIWRDAGGVPHCPSCGSSEFDYGKGLLRMVMRWSLLWRLLLPEQRQSPKPYSSDARCRRCRGFVTWDDRRD